MKICDFGMALVKNVSFTGPSMMQIGSPYYTPPEQSQNPGNVDGRADLFATGVLLYRMLTGRLPGMQAFSLSMVNPLFDTTWDDFFSKALNWNPDLRFASANAMQDALENLQINWQAQQEQRPPVKPAVIDRHRLILRKEAVQICGSKAQSLFGIDAQYRPRVSMANDLFDDREYIHDKSTTLLWQKGGSEYPISWQEAVVYIETLKGATATEEWRLPTINELLSLFGTLHAINSSSSGFDVSKNRLWSCDSHTNHERWLVNFDMGYTASQDMNCFNFVRGVRSI